MTTPPGSVPGIWYRIPGAGVEEPAEPEPAKGPPLTVTAVDIDDRGYATITISGGEDNDDE